MIADINKSKIPITDPAKRGEVLNLEYQPCPKPREKARAGEMAINHQRVAGQWAGGGAVDRLQSIIDAGGTGR